MPYFFEPNRLYRMPTHFGPSLGPRQGPDGKGYSCDTYPRQRILSASFNADHRQLETLLPPRFELPDNARVHVDFAEISEIAWLAGRGYNTFGVAVDAVFRGDRDTVNGRLLLVLWENMADPIITGREELGFSKVYCELPAIKVRGDTFEAHASWDGHGFGTLSLIGAEEVPPDSFPASDSEGTLHLKYMPKTGTPGKADAHYVTFTPAGAPNCRIERLRRCRGAKVGFTRSTWEQLPTLVNIVNGLADLELGPSDTAWCLETHGFKDLRDQRALY